MPREYMNLPTLLDALEDEMDLGAGAVAAAARAVQERGLGAMARSHEAIKKKGDVVRRLEEFAEAMEKRNVSNMPPVELPGATLTAPSVVPLAAVRPTNGAGSSPISPAVGAAPAEVAHLPEVKGDQPPTDAEAYAALNALPLITKEEGMKMRTGRPTPNEGQ